MKLKKNLFTICLLCFFSLFFIFNFKNVYADSIRPVVNGDYDSYVSNYKDSDDGYKEPDDVNNPGATVHVQNANQLLEAIGYVKGGVAASKSYNDPVSQIHKIILDNDISLSDATDYHGFATNFSSDHSSMASYAYLSVNHNNLVIDGQGHTLDMLFNAFAPDGSLTGNQWTLENMKLYGSSWWGPISTNSAFTINYRNLDYYGSQLIWSTRVPNVKVNIYGNVACHSLLVYKPLKGDGYEYDKGQGGSSSKLYGYLCEGGSGNQQNMQAGDIEFHVNSKYFGESYNGNCLELQGGSKLDNNAKVELHPHGISAEDGPSGNSAGLYLYQSGSYKSQITFSSNNNMEIYCDNSDVSNSDGSHYAPNNPNQLSCGFYATNATDAYLNKGIDSHLIVRSAGQVYNNNPLVNIQSMNAYVSNKGNSFEIYDDAQNQYIPSSGVLNTSNSNINVNDQGTFIMRIRNIPQTNTTNYLLSSTSSIIDINRPKEVVLSNDTYDNTQNNFLNQMSSTTTSTHNYIRIRNGSVNSIIYDNINSPNGFSGAPGIPAKDILLPLYGSRLYVPGIRLKGSYFDNIQFANSVNKTLDSNETAQNFNYVDIKGTPIPNIESTEHNNVNTHNPYISGKVVDENGNAIRNAYIKAKLDGHSDFIRPSPYIEASLVKSDFINYINSYEILYNVMRSYLPKDIGSSAGGDLVTNNNFYSTLDGFYNPPINNPLINPALQKNYFGIANNFFFQKFGSNNVYKQFNSGVTMYNADGKMFNDNAYLGMTDSNGNFKIQVPQSVFDSLQKESTNKSYVNIIPSYNFTDGPAKKVLISYNPLINIENTLKDITYPDANSDDGSSLNKVFQGGQGRSEDGDTLEFDDKLSNTSNNSDVRNTSFTQPVPQSINESTLQISYDGGKHFSKLENNDYSVNMNDDGTKNIVINHIDLKSGQIVNLAIRGTMKVSYGDEVNNNSINFKPSITYNDNEYDSGNNNKIIFTDNQLKFKPNDIYFGDAKIIKNQLISPVNTNQPIITDFKDDRRDKTMANIYVQQENDRFYSDDDSSNSFSGNLILDGNVLNVPTLIFKTNGTDDLYLNNNRSIYLIPNEDFNGSGSYSTKLDWTVNYGIN
ncbi:hypothetical protein [Apilactobacillus ozensis]|uniref:hypothetical protein n=1 Tax=Apilactobacillus ozensis TaxID=866801 RepID=UPI002009FB67|nr:hypothetical protein [Apilactobacillus ozensis]MCK8607131.1 hypothetical protein [Apilactobacillus ozensis]